MELRLNTRAISGFTSLMGVIKQALKVNMPNVTFTSTSPETTPTESVNTPIISYKMISKEPGDMKNAKEIKPRLRETITLAEEDMDGIEGNGLAGRAIEVWGQMFDYDVEFSVYGHSDDEAAITADKFQQFMFKYTGYLKKLGVSEIIFTRMKHDDTSTTMPCKKINYYMRIDEVVGIKAPGVENIDIETHIIKDVIIQLMDLYIEEHTTENQ
jgi:hypothetical protein